MNIKKILLTQTFKQQYVSYMQANLSVCFWLPTYRFLFLCTLQSGLIRFSGEELLITPLTQHLALQHNYSAPSGHHPHVIYKRSAERRVYADKTDWSSSVKSNNPYENHDRHHHTTTTTTSTESSRDNTSAWLPQAMYVRTFPFSYF